MIQLTNLSKRFTNKELFNDVNFKLPAGARVGLVGRNGSGKSTLFKLILGEESSDSGEVTVPKGYQIGTLRQHLSFSKPTLREEAALALGDAQYDFYKVEKILFGLGFVKEDLETDPASFSGGYQIRINLAKLLVTEPSLLLLDEPTNYLDILSLRWLKTFLQNFEGEVIIITHNRDFMDSVTTHTMGIVRKKLSFLEGNTHKFYAQLQANDELHEKQKASQDKKVKELETFIAKNKARASTAALAQSKVKQLEKMELLDDLYNDATLSFNFNYLDTHAKVLLDVSNLAFGYSSDHLLFKDVSFTLKKGECLAIIGKNGKGKSTLLNTIAGELTPSQGEVNFHASVEFAHFGQTNIDHLNPKNTIMDEIYVGNPQLSESSVRSICGAMMFSGEDAKKEISLLSGGEKSRVMLGQILTRSENLLFLDEPTNHLDMESIDSLTEAIETFEGGVIIVTHSEELLRRVANRLIVFEKGGAEYFDGGYDLFLEKRGWDEEEEQKESVKTVSKNNQKEIKKQRSALIKERNQKTAPLRKKVEKLEEQIMEREEELEVNQEALLEASNVQDNSKIIELSQVISQQEEEVEKLFEQMEEVQGEVDVINEEFEQKIKSL
jgi:ATP-binding cassette subfamily F protein 3